MMPATRERHSAGPSAVFEALSDLTRRRLIERLSTFGPVTITSLSRELPISRQAVTKHLDTLYDAGLVEWERRGRERIVTFRPAPLSEASDWIAAIEARWDRRLAALADYLAEDQSSPPTPSLPDSLGKGGC
jgi:DNA-binding transcriptional ArsR family regulator